MTTENVSVDDGGSGEAGGEVTYVNGIAVEQETPGETPEEGSDHGDELAAAKRAVKEAFAEEGKKAAKEAKEHLDRDPLQKAKRAADGKFTSAKDPAEQELEDAKAKVAKETVEPKEAPEDKEASQLRRALQERKETARYKAEAAAEVEKMRAEARQFYQQLQQEKAELAREKQRLEMLRKDPIRAIKENGWDPEEFILDIASDGTPEGQARRQQRDIQAQLAEIANWRKEQAAQAEQRAIEQENHQKAQNRQNVEQQFLRTAGARAQDGTHANPHLVAMYKNDPEGLVAEADRVANRYRDATGQEATFQELTEYLEERAAKWYKELSSERASKVGAPVTQGKPTQGSATGRSLSPSGSSERRSLGTSIKDLDGDERREAAMEAVRAALHASGER